MADARHPKLVEIEIPASATERRKKSRRQEDLTAGTMEWLDWLIRSKTKLAGIVALIAGVSGFMVRDLGFKVSSPTQEMAQLEKRALSRDSAARIERESIKAEVTVLKSVVGDIRGDLRALTTIQCAQLRLQHSPLLDECPQRRRP